LACVLIETFFDRSFEHSDQHYNYQPGHCHRIYFLHHYSSYYWCFKYMATLYDATNVYANAIL
jgi:hypothetical protein